MGKYKLVFKDSVKKDLRRIPKSDVQRILTCLEDLSENPRLPGVRKISGEEKYRLLQGRYRILYRIDDQIVEVMVVKIGHRKNIYENKG